MITLQFSRVGGPETWAIAAFERGWCSHVDAVLPDGSLLGARCDAIGGQPPGVRIRPAGYEAWTRVEIVHLPATAEVEAAFWSFLHDQVGTPYDELAIAGFAFDRDWRNPAAWFCSELIARALEVSRWLPALLSCAVNEITPRDLELLVSPWGLAA